MSSSSTATAKNWSSSSRIARYGFTVFGDEVAACPLFAGLSGGQCERLGQAHYLRQVLAAGASNEEMVIEGLTDEEEEAFLKAIAEG